MLLSDRRWTKLKGQVKCVKLCVFASIRSNSSIRMCNSRYADSSLYLMPYGRTMQDYVYSGKLNAKKKNGRILDFKNAIWRFHSPSQTSVHTRLDEFAGRDENSSCPFKCPVWRRNRANLSKVPNSSSSLWTEAHSHLWSMHTDPPTLYCLPSW